MNNIKNNKKNNSSSFFTSPIEKLKECYLPLLGNKYFIKQGKGFLGVVEEILDEEYVKVRDIKNRVYNISIFNIRDLTYCNYVQE